MNQVSTKGWLIFRSKAERLLLARVKNSGLSMDSAERSMAFRIFEASSTLVKSRRIFE